jgi:hypothetical protein
MARKGSAKLGKARPVYAKASKGYARQFKARQA